MTSNKIKLHLILHRWYKNSDTTPLDYNKLIDELKEEGFV